MEARNGTEDDPLYVICRSGSRAGRRASSSWPRLSQRRQRRRAARWLGNEAGLPVVRGKKAISLERQVRIAAGSLVVLGTALGAFVHPGFLGLSAFVGAGLVFAGITDTCGMGMLLARMPWNRVDGFRALFSRTGGLIMKLLIVGGVAGGASAAARARRLSEDAEIVLFERGPDVSFANCGLPYYVGGEIAERNKLLVVHAGAAADPLQARRANSAHRSRPSTARRRRSVSATSLRGGSTRKPTTS